MATTVTMPRLGESIVEGTVGKWLVQEGQHVEKDQPLVEILTDKADSEVPAPVSGILTKQLATEEQVVAVGKPLCEIDETASAVAQPKAGQVKAPSPKGREPAPAATASVSAGIEHVAASASPAIRKLAREKGVALGSVSGTGQGGRITKDDVMKASSPEPSNMAEAPALGRAERAPSPLGTRGVPTGAFRLPPYTPRPGDEIVPFSRRRRIIADHMVYSKSVAPDVVTLAECDMHRTSLLREAHKVQLKQEGVNLTYLAFVCAAVCRSLRENPELNARVLEDSYVKLRDINLGIAVDTPEGLVVPVIRNADELTVRGLSRAIEDLGNRARDGRLAPDDLANKTFTVSNPGLKGNLVGAAIISQPNVAILRMGTMKKRVVVVEKDDEDLMAIHPVMHAALSYDHRIVDGVKANGFLWRVVEILESADFDL